MIGLWRILPSMLNKERMLLSLMLQLSDEANAVACEVIPKVVARVRMFHE